MKTIIYTYKIENLTLTIVDVGSLYLTIETDNSKIINNMVMNDEDFKEFQETNKPFLIYINECD